MFIFVQKHDSRCTSHLWQMHILQGFFKVLGLLVGASSKPLTAGSKRATVGKEVPRSEDSLLVAPRLVHQTCSVIALPEYLHVAFLPLLDTCKYDCSAAVSAVCHLQELKSLEAALANPASLSPQELKEKREHLGRTTQVSQWANDYRDKDSTVCFEMWRAHVAHCTKAGLLRQLL